MQIFSATALAGLFALLSLGACSDPVTASDSANSLANSPPTTASKPAAAACADSSFVRGRLLGAVEAEIDWAPAAITCEGGPRPDGEGVRLRFARAGDDGAGLAVIIAIPGLAPDSTGTGFAANVTLILEGEARFFSTQNREACWADIAGNESIGESRYTIAGELYCIAPLTEVNGPDSVTVDGLGFSGTLQWGSS